MGVGSSVPPGPTEKEVEAKMTGMIDSINLYMKEQGLPELSEAQIEIIKNHSTTDLAELYDEGDETHKAVSDVATHMSENASIIKNTELHSALKSTGAHKLVGRVINASNSSGTPLSNQLTEPSHEQSPEQSNKQSGSSFISLNPTTTPSKGEARISAIVTLEDVVITLFLCDNEKSTGKLINIPLKVSSLGLVASALPEIIPAIFTPPSLLLIIPPLLYNLKIGPISIASFLLKLKSVSSNIPSLIKPPFNLNGLLSLMAETVKPLNNGITIEDNKTNPDTTSGTVLSLNPSKVNELITNPKAQAQILTKFFENITANSSLPQQNGNSQAAQAAGGGKSRKKNKRSNRRKSKGGKKSNKRNTKGGKKFRKNNKRSKTHKK